MAKKTIDERDYNALENLIRDHLNAAMSSVYRDASSLHFDGPEVRIALMRIVAARSLDVLWADHQDKADVPRALKRIERLLNPKTGAAFEAAVKEADGKG